MPRNGLELEVGTDVLLLETGDALLLESAPVVTPPTLALILTLYAPTILTPSLITPLTLALSLTTYAPKVIIGTIVTPGKLALVLTTFAPTIISPLSVSARIAFVSDPFDITPTWTDVSADLVAFSTKRGRQHQLDRIEAGTATVLLKNFTQYDNLLSNGSFEVGDPPTGWTAVRSVLDQEDTIVKIGSHSLKITSNGVWAIGKSSEVSGYANYASKKVTLGAWVCALSTNDKDQRFTIVDGVGETPGDVIPRDDAWHWMTVTRTVDANPTGLRTEFYSNYSAVSDTDDILYVDGAILVEGDSCLPTAPRGDYWPNNTEGTYYPEVKLGKRINIKAAYGGRVYDEYTGFVRRWAPFWFSQAGNLYPGMRLECADLQRNLARAKLNHAGYAQQKSGTRIGSVLTTVGWPAADRDIDTGKENMIATGAMANVNAMEHLFKVQESELGILFVRGDGYTVFHERGALEDLESQATFGTGNLPIFDPVFPLDDELLYNEVRLTREGGTEQVESNAASILAHSLRTLSRSGLLLTSDVIVKLYCLYLIARYHAAKMRIKSFTVKPQADPTNLWPLVLGLEIGQKITLVWTEADINGPYFIEGIEHSWDYREGVWVTKYQCSDAGQFYFEPGTFEDLLRPNAAGDETNIDNVVGKPTHWEAVEDSSTGTYVINDTTSWQRDLYNVGSLVGSGGTISKITAYILCIQENYAGGVTGHVKVAIKSGDTVAEGDAEMPGIGAWDTFSKEWALNPDTGEAWTWDEIEDLQIGVNMKGGSLGSSPPYWMKCMRVWVEVTYIPAW